MIVICAAILPVRYGYGYERFFRLWSNGAGVHPFTALALVLLAFGALLRPRFRKSSLSILFYAAAFSIGASHIIDSQFGWHIFLAQI